MFLNSFKKFPAWKKNLYVVWVGSFITGIAMSSVMPFLPLYISTLGNYSKSQVNLYSSLSFAASFIVAAIVSPLWGRLADRYGRRPMLIRASTGLVVVMFSLSFVNAPWQIITLRLLQGAFSGYIANATALVANQTPDNEVGHALGITATGFTSGSLIGPLFGGAMASFLGYRFSFIVTAALLSLVVILTILLVTEDRSKLPKAGEKITKSRDIWKSLPNFQLTIIIFISTMIVQTALNTINPIVSLFVKELLNNHNSTAMVAGLVAAAPGITTIISSPRFGVFGQKVGTKQVAMMGFAIGALALISTFFVSSIVVLIGFRLLAGIANGAMTPALQTMLTQNTPKEYTSRIFSYNQSFQSIGNFLGPILGGLVANTFDYRGVFLVGGFLLLLNLIIFLLFVNKKTAN